jgi:hypothetical protein
VNLLHGIEGMIMRSKNWFVPSLAALGLACFLVGLPGEAVTVTGIKNQLRVVFNNWDLNSDGYLDKEELAKAFRGPSAKPYDYKYSSEKDKDSAKLKKKPDYKTYPDYLFLIQLDGNGDKRISRKEWETWAKAYAKELKSLIQTQEKVQKYQAKVKSAATTSAKRRAQASYERYYRQLLSLQKKQTAYESKLIKAMESKGKH